MARLPPIVRRSLGQARWKVSAPLRSLSNSRPQPCLPIARLIEGYGPEGTNPPVLFFGDSVLCQISRYDRHEGSLGRMLQERLRPHYESLVVAESGYHPEIFRALAQVLLTLPGRPSLVVVSVNIRCFSPQWDLNPDWQYDDVLDAARRFIASPSEAAPTVMPAGASDDLARAQYLATRVCCPGRPDASVADYVRRIERRPTNPEEALERSRDIFFFHYLSIAASGNRRLHSLEGLLASLRQSGCAVLCYLTPINHEAGHRLIGEEFARFLTSTVETVQRTIFLEGWPQGRFAFFDWTSMLPASSFFHNLDPTEHLNEEGRRRLADMLSEETSRLLAEVNGAS